MSKSKLTVTRRSLTCELLLICFLVESFIFLQSINTIDKDSFIRLCQIGTIDIVISFIILSIAQKRVLTIPNLFFLFFSLFQFGVPILYAIYPNYTNFYTSLIDINILIKGCKYSILSNLVFSMGLVIASSLKQQKKNAIIFSKHSYFHEYTFMKKASIFLIVASGVVAIPIYTIVALLSIRNGFSQSTRDLLSSNAIFNLARAFFIPSCFLYLCYCDRYKDKVSSLIVKFCIFYACIMSLIIGDRSTSISWLTAYFYDLYVQSASSTHCRTKRNGKSIFLILVFFAIAVIASYIATNRVGSQNRSIGDILKGNVFALVTNEMGFNFFSICFVQMYVPQITSFQFGLTYLKSIVGLIPNSIDFLGITDKLVLPGQWMINMNHQRFGTLLDFGTGFSFNAESYMNFSWGGIIISFFMPLMLKNTLNTLNENDQGWERYYKIAVFSALVTFPRRTLSETLSALEYQLFFLGIYLILAHYIISRKSHSEHV